MYKSYWAWTLGCSKHVEDTIIKLKLYCKGVHFVGSYYIGVSQYRLKECKVYSDISKDAIVLGTAQTGPV
jgi:hypothetical protein